MIGNLEYFSRIEWWRPRLQVNSVEPTKLHQYSASLLGVHRAVVPPDPFSNSEVKRSIADGSVGSPHVRVGQRQALIPKRRTVSTVRRFHFNKVLMMILYRNGKSESLLKKCLTPNKINSKIANLR